LEDNIKMNLKEEGLGPVAGSCEHDNEPSVSIKIGQFLDPVNDYPPSRKTLFLDVSRLISSHFVKPRSISGRD
jgi:hypothetical protein